MVRPDWIAIWALGALAFAPAAPAAAQGVFDMGVLTNTLTIPRGSATKTVPPGRGAGAATPGTRAIGTLSAPLAGRASTRSDNTRLPYTVTPALRRTAVAAYINRAARQHPEAARIMAAQFAKHDYGAVYRTMLAGTGLRDDDAIDAVVTYTLLSWQIANRNPAEIPETQVQALRGQIAPAIAANPSLSASAARADLGEEMKLLTVTLHAGWQSAVKEGTTARFSDGVTRLFQSQSGRNLRSLKLSGAGLSRN